MNTHQIIDDLGGTSAVARFCSITPGAVSQWKTSPNGIPKAWLRLLIKSFPEAFGMTKKRAKTHGLNCRPRAKEINTCLLVVTNK